MPAPFLSLGHAPDELAEFELRLHRARGAQPAPQLAVEALDEIARAQQRPKLLRLGHEAQMLVEVGEGDLDGLRVSGAPTRSERAGGLECAVTAVGPEYFSEVGKELLPVGPGDAVLHVAQLVNDAQLMRRVQALGDGGDDAFVRVRDDEPLGFGIEPARDQVLEHPIPGIFALAIADAEPEDMRAAILVDAERDEQGLFVGEARPAHGQVEGVEEQVDDAGRDRTGLPLAQDRLQGVAQAADGRRREATPGDRLELFAYGARRSSAKPEAHGQRVAKAGPEILERVEQRQLERAFAHDGPLDGQPAPQTGKTNVLEAVAARSMPAAFVGIAAQGLVALDDELRVERFKQDGVHFLGYNALDSSRLNGGLDALTDLTVSDPFDELANTLHGYTSMVCLATTIVCPCFSFTPSS